MNDWDDLVEPARSALETLISKGDDMADRIDTLAAKLAKVEAERDAADKLIAATFADAASNNIRLAEASHRAEAAEAALVDANNALIAFGSGVMVKFAKDRGLPDGHLFATHYDILAKAGARMDSFKRGRGND